ncbi:MAG: putative membrane protein SirB2 [Halieaceae bacterium]|jgi:uncharacterized membrane protein SirB2
MYSIVKMIHIAAVALSISGFLLRASLLLAGIDYRNNRLSRILPHVIDTILLGTAVGLAVMSSQYPLQQDWLSAKVLALLAYIVLGTWALKWARSPREKMLAMVTATLCFTYIVSVALTRSPMGFWG